MKTQQNSKPEEILQILEDDYIKSIDDNEMTTVESFIEKFLYESWTYNHQNIEYIKQTMQDYSKGDLQQPVFVKSFNKMVYHLQKKLILLDESKQYPLLHNEHGAFILVAIVDGLIVQYYTGNYEVEQLKEITPLLKNTILQALKTTS
ncbi:hypothetical protein [Exiguobacterium sp. s127]|uniref:hypothetical protein n=1 Tax=Exiguobacterium sp. s127 TaxID=2751210 RepID=UPI001BEBCC36|nr:hypothetical protein [Exiguobacterium sp. s127]